MKLTEQQVAFCEELRSGASHIALRARAGTGKTSTILEGVDVLVEENPRAEIQCVMFNKKNADETKGKLLKRGHTNWKTVGAATVHSMGYGLVRFAFNNPTIDEKKVYKLIDAKTSMGSNWSSNFDQRDPENDWGAVYQNYGTQIANLVGYAKGEGFGFFPDRQIGDLHAWYQMADHYDVNGFDDTDDADAVIEAAQVIYRESLAQTDVIDFDDMILFPLVKNLRVKFGKDIIFLDEAQDLSRAKQALAMKFLKRDGRMIVVGDDRQAIYGFSGADSNAMGAMIEKLGAKVMPLSVSWRCPKAVIRLAQTLVPDIEAAPTAIEGEVRTLLAVGRDPDTGEEYDPIAREFETLGPDDAILCRNMAPLITIAYGLIRQGKACKVEGRAIGEGLIALVKRWKIKTISALLDRLAIYQERERQKAMAKQNERKAEEVDDKCGTIREICEALIKQGKKDISDVVSFIDQLFEDGATGVTILATYHRSKGREWPRVYLWEHHSRCPSKMARQPWQVHQETNLAYVAFTRAQRELIFVGN